MNEISYGTRGQRGSANGRFRYSSNPSPRSHAAMFMAAPKSSRLELVSLT
jgi:hypothetical protein